MPEFLPSSQHTAHIGLQNTGPVAAQFVVKAQVQNGLDGSTVGQSAELRLEPGQSGSYSAALTMPGSSGQYALGGEIWGRRDPSGDFLLVAGFQNLGEPVLVGQTPDRSIAEPEGGISKGVLIAAAAAAGVGMIAWVQSRRR